MNRNKDTSADYVYGKSACFTKLVQCIYKYGIILHNFTDDRFIMKHIKPIEISSFEQFAPHYLEHVNKALEEKVHELWTYMYMYVGGCGLPSLDGRCVGKFPRWQMCRKSSYTQWLRPLLGCVCAGKFPAPNN